MALPLCRPPKCPIRLRCTQPRRSTVHCSTASPGQPFRCCYMDVLSLACPRTLVHGRDTPIGPWCLVSCRDRRITSCAPEEESLIHSLLVHTNTAGTESVLLSAFKFLQVLRRSAGCKSMAPLQLLLGPAARPGSSPNNSAWEGLVLSEKHDDVCRMGGFKPLPQPSQWPAAMLDRSPPLRARARHRFDSIRHLARGSNGTLSAASWRLIFCFDPSQVPWIRYEMHRCVREVTTASWHLRHGQAVNGKNGPLLCTVYGYGT
jgi:hypothetical protein